MPYNTLKRKSKNQPPSGVGFFICGQAGSDKLRLMKSSAPD